MGNFLTIEEFYDAGINGSPGGKKEAGFFHVFDLADFLCNIGKQIPYSQKNYYKISLVIGRNNINYADKTYRSDKAVLLFSNPLIPYNWEALDDDQQGYFCIFTAEFFSHFGNIREFPVFQPGGNAVFMLSEDEVKDISDVFREMMAEMRSDYEFKEGLLRNLVFSIVHKVLKLHPAPSIPNRGTNASQRIVSLFMELLGRQYPIESPQQRIRLDTPKDFADHMSIHTNHLNRSLKMITGKTTSQLISERLVMEAKSLLKNTNWNISEIAYALGFEESSHFTNAFKKFVQITPKAFRELQEQSL